MRIMRSVHRRVSWLMAAKSFKVPVIGTMAKGIAAVPVARSMDVIKKAEGRIYLAEDDESQLRIVRGVATNFGDSLFQVGGSIHVTIGVETIKLEILSIHGPEKLVINKAPEVEIAQLLTDRGGFEFKVSPKMDQTAVYEAVFDKLKSDGCVGIFPEGGSHDRTDLLSLQGMYCISVVNLTNVC